MSKEKTKKIYYYDSFDQDFAETKQQDYKIPSDYKWMHISPIYHAISLALYIVIVVLDLIYMKLFAHITVKNRHLLLKARLFGGYYLYSNHTQTFGDVVNPFAMTFPTRPSIICSPSNLGIPFVGKLLPMAGAIPIPDNMSDFKKFNQTISRRIKIGDCIVIYPEQHLWPYYTKIRPLADAAFHYPIKVRKPVYVATTTYQKSRIFKKPKITIYIDGPFKASEDLSKKDAQKRLKYEVQKTMERRAKHSTFEYVTYRKKSKK